MLKGLLTAAACIALTAPALARAQDQGNDAPPQPTCWDKAQTQTELTMCAADEAKAAEARLKASYEAALKYVEPEDRPQFDKVQDAWAAYRDADCALWGGGGGSIAPMNASVCLASLDNERADELDGWPPNAPRDEDEPTPGADR